MNHGPQTVDELLDQLNLLLDQHSCEKEVRDESGYVRYRGSDLERSIGLVEQLGEIDDGRAVPILCERLKISYCECFDYTPTLRLSGALVNALGAIADDRAVPILCAQLEQLEQLEPDNYERLNDLAHALERIDDPSTLPALSAVDPGPVQQPYLRGDDDHHYAVYRRQRNLYEAHQAIERMRSRHGRGPLRWLRRRCVGLAKQGRGAPWVEYGFRYRRGDLVKFKGAYYRCMGSHKSLPGMFPDEREPGNAGRGYWKPA